MNWGGSLDIINADLKEAIGRIKEKTPGEWSIEFCIGQNGKFYFLQQRRLTDVEPPANFTIDEIKQAIDPVDIIFEGKLTRGKTPKEGIICDVVAEEYDVLCKIKVLSIGLYHEPEIELRGLKRFDALHRKYALVFDYFTGTQLNIHQATPNKRAIITVNYATRTSHVLDIIRTEVPHLVYVGIEDRKALLEKLREAGRIRIFADGYRALIALL